MNKFHAAVCFDALKLRGQGALPFPTTNSRYQLLLGSPVCIAACAVDPHDERQRQPVSEVDADGNNLRGLVVLGVKIRFPPIAHAVNGYSRDLSVEERI